MKRLLKITFLTGLLTLLKMLMGFVIAKVVAIYTGPAGMTMLGQVQSVVTALNGIVSSPAGNSMVRFTSEKQGEGYSSCALWWRASVQWIIVITILVLILGVVFAKQISLLIFQDYKYSWLILVIVLTLPLSVLGTLLNSVINGLQSYRRFVFLGMISVLISGSLMIAMIMNAHLHGALLAVALQSGIIGIVMFVFNVKQPWFKWRYWWGKTTNLARKKISGYILMAIVTALTTPLALIAVRNILVSNVGWQQAGEWQAVWKISEAYLSIITIALSTYYLPQLSTLKTTEAIIIEIKKTIIITLPFSILLAVSVYLLRDVAIYILFTSEFKSARDLFFVQLCGDVIKMASWIYAYPMISRGATKWFVLSEIIFSSLFVLLTYCLVGKFGVEGANYAYVANYSIYFFFVYGNVKKFAK